MSMTRTLYSVSGLATELAKDRRTISRALAAVPPDGKVGAHPAWHMLTALAALGWTGRKSDGERLDAEHEWARKDKALADLHEMRLARQRGKFVDIELIGHDVMAAFSLVRTNFLAFPHKLASQMPDSVARDVYRIADDQVDALLRYLSEDAVLEAA